MFTAILTVTHDDGVTTTISDGYAASGADELHDFVLELLTRARTTAQKNACIANLKQIDGAVQQWALENKKSGTATVGTTVGQRTKWSERISANFLPAT